MQSSHYSRQILIKLQFLETVSKSPQMSYLTKTRPVVADLFHPETRTDGRAEMARTIIAFR